MNRDPCRFDGCKHFAQRAGLCWGHIKQMLQGKQLKPLRPYRMSAQELVAYASKAVWECDTREEADAEFERARERLRVYTYRAQIRKTRRAYKVHT